MKKISKKRLKKLSKSQNKTIKLDKIEIYDFGKMNMNFSNIQLTRSHLKLLRLKDCTVRNCSFTQSIISDDSYLRHAKFVNVDFTGTLFRDTNLEKAEFLNCNMKYVRFENCLLNCNSIIKNSLPVESNLKLGVLNQLYKNEISNGNTEKADEILYLIRDAERKESWDILTSSEEYFRETRKNNVLKYFGKYLIASWDKYIWGYGLRVKQILVTMIIVVVLFAVIYFLFLFSSDQAFITRIENSFLTSVNAILIGNLDIDKVKMEKENLFQAVVLVQNGIGILYFALITSAVYRRIAR